MAKYANKEKKKSTNFPFINIKRNPYDNVWAVIDVWIREYSHLNIVRSCLKHRDYNFIIIVDPKPKTR